MSTHADKLRDKIRADFEAVSRRNTDSTSTIKEVVSEVASAEWTGRTAADVLRDCGFDALADALPYNPPADDALTWGDLTDGAYIPALDKFKSFMPDPAALSRMFLYMHKGWTILLKGPPST